MIVLNLKTYMESIERPFLFTDIASEVVAETGVRIIVCPPQLHMHEAAERFGDVFAQHADADKPGAGTGSVPPELLKAVKAKGSLINHSERRVAPETIRSTVGRLHSLGLESLVCANSAQECASLAAYSPTFIAVEPPELIGSGISVSKARPEVVADSVKAVRGVDERIPLLCGAGISTKEDVAKALALGAKGVLLASAFVKAKDPKALLQGFASVF